MSVLYSYDSEVYCEESGCKNNIETHFSTEHILELGWWILPYHAYMTDGPIHIGMNSYEIDQGAVFCPKHAPPSQRYPVKFSK